MNELDQKPTPEDQPDMDGTKDQPDTQQDDNDEGSDHTVEEGKEEFPNWEKVNPKVGL